MNRNWYGNAVLTLLLAAVVFFGIMVVNALDRVHAALRNITVSGTVPAAAAAVPVEREVSSPSLPLPPTGNILTLPLIPAGA